MSNDDFEITKLNYQDTDDSATKEKINENVSQNAPNKNSIDKKGNKVYSCYYTNTTSVYFLIYE